MERLTTVIGLAPSEMPREQLMQLIRAEHQRVAVGVETYGSQKKKGAKKAPTGPKKLSGKALLVYLDAKGVSIEEYKDMLEVQKQIKQLEAEAGKD
jgi:hypothetical protein